jgi:hypothetical protein
MKHYRYTEVTRFAATVILALTLCLTAVAQSKPATSHLCGAPTKVGATCKRKVANKHGANALCFQHKNLQPQL